MNEIDSEVIKQVPLAKFVSSGFNTPVDYVRIYADGNKMVLLKPAITKTKIGNVKFHEIAECEITSHDPEKLVYHLYWSDAMNFMNMMFVHSKTKNSRISIKYYPDEGCAMFDNTEFREEGVYIELYKTVGDCDRITAFHATKVYRSEFQKITREYQEPPIATEA